jgi:hypothetical protein
MENKKVLEWFYRKIQQRKYGAADRIICRIRNWMKDSKGALS